MRKTALIYMALASALMPVAAFAGGESGRWLFVLAGLPFPSALIALAAANSPRGGAVGRVALVLAVLLTGTGAAVLLLDRVGPDAVPPLGLPVSTTVALLGLGLLPLALVGWAHGATFDDRRDR